MVLWGSADSPRGHLIVSPQVCIVRMTIPHKAILRRFPIRIRLCVLVCVCVCVLVRCDNDEKFLLMYALLKLKLIRGKMILFVNTIDRCYKYLLSCH